MPFQPSEEDVIRQLQQNLAWLQKAASNLQQQTAHETTYAISSDLFEEALRALEKRAFAPPGGPPGMPPGMPMDPAMMGGMPPGMPMDPAMMGGMPPGGPPGMPPGMPPGGPPGMPPGMPPGGPPGMPPGGPPGLPPGLPPDILAGLGGLPPGPEAGGPPPEAGPAGAEGPESSANRLMDMSVDEFKGAMTEAVEKGVSGGFADLARALDDVVDKLNALVSALSANVPGNPKPMR